MVRYTRQPKTQEKTAKARQDHVRVHYKNTYETGQALKGMSLKRAKSFLWNVIHHKEIVPFRKYTGGIGRHAQAKNHRTNIGRWPIKSARCFLDIIQNAEANAVSKGLKKNRLALSHVHVNHAAKMRRRTFRAHGRINPWMYSPCHVELFLTEKTGAVATKKNKGSKAHTHKLENGAQA
eukprot:gb/GECH01011174.1/.p1 GENE.gb/GECH01011174.1/~~gb/GECH01011174.1/.p1  ORF type:complete len:179 (+),score=21.99 gb/GECH01011174.1/:1-537(+)